jgi:hypothetical protein
MKGVRLTRSNWVNDWLAGDAGEVRVLEDQQAYEAVEVHKLAEYAPEHDPRDVPTYEIPVRKRQDPVEFPARAQVADVPEDFDGGVPEEVVVEMKQPWTTAPKAHWINWAIQNGCDPAIAAGMSKTALMSSYGERL